MSGIGQLLYRGSVPTQVTGRCIGHFAVAIGLVIKLIYQKAGILAGKRGIELTLDLSHRGRRDRKVGIYKNAVHADVIVFCPISYFGLFFFILRHGEEYNNRILTAGQISRCREVLRCFGTCQSVCSTVDAQRDLMGCFALLKSSIVDTDTQGIAACLWGIYFKRKPNPFLAGFIEFTHRIAVQRINIGGIRNHSLPILVILTLKLCVINNLYTGAPQHIACIGGGQGLVFRISYGRDPAIFTGALLAFTAGILLAFTAGILLAFTAGALLACLAGALLAFFSSRTGKYNRRIRNHQHKHQ